MNPIHPPVAPRPQHHDFAHRFLHPQFFEEPRSLIDFLLGPRGLSNTREVWNDLGRDHPEQIEKIDAGGLHLRRCLFNDRNGVLITLPPAMAATEAHFIALIDDGAEGLEARYFLSEMTAPQPDGSQPAVLCEWLSSGQRRNHELMMPPTEEAFIDEITRQLKAEQVRADAGEPAIMAPTWDVTAGPEPIEVTGAVERDYRLHPCIFAFHLLPQAIASRQGGLTSADVERIQARVDELWNMAAAISRKAGGGFVDARPTVSRVSTPSGDASLIRMPHAVAPPEPAFVLLPSDSVAAQGLYLIELGDARRRSGVFTSITPDGTHQVFHGVKDAEARTLIDAVEALSTRSPFMEPPTAFGASAIDNLMEYPAIAHAYRGVIDGGRGAA